MKKLICITMVLVGLQFHVKAQVIDTHRGPMEIFGLKNWTVKMIEDTMRHIAPNQPMVACAAVMKEQLGFPETSVIGYGENNKMYWYSILVEPERAHLIQAIEHNFKRTDKTYEAYKPMLEYYNASFRDHQVAMGTYGKWRTGKVKEAEETVKRVKVSIETVRSIWKELAKFSTAQELNRAIDILNNDANVGNRMIALTVLMNFPNEDSAWRQVIKSQLDRDEMMHVSTMSSSVSLVFSRDYRKKVDWSPIKEEIRKLINGINANAFMPTLEILNNGEIDGELVRYALQDGGHIVTSVLSSSHEKVRKPAHEFLLRASGKDFGKDPQEWEQWIDSELVRGQ